MGSWLLKTFLISKHVVAGNGSDETKHYKDFAHEGKMGGHRGKVKLRSFKIRIYVQNVNRARCSVYC